MSWTVACFCGTLFKAPAERCPTCGVPVPAMTREPVQEKSSKGSSISSPARKR